MALRSITGAEGMASDGQTQVALSGEAGSRDCGPQAGRRIDQKLGSDSMGMSA